MTSHPSRWWFRSAVAVLVLAWAGAALAVEDLIREARNYLVSGQLNAGVIQLKNALQQQPNNAEARYLLGISYLQTGDINAAEKELRRASELGWDRNQVLPPLAKVMLFRRDFQLLIDSFPVTDQDPPELRSDLLALRAVAELALGREALAEQLLTQARELNPSGREAMLGSVQLAILRQDYAAAEQWLDRILADDASRVDGWLAKGHVHFLKGEVEQSLAAFDKALELQPRNLVGLLGRAGTLRAAGRGDDALADIDLALQIQRQQPQANFLKAQIFADRGDVAEATTALTRVLAVVSDHRPAQLLLGTINYNQGNMAQAVSYLERFVSAFPWHLQAVKLLAAAQTRLGRPAEAVKLLQPLLVRPEAQQDAQFYALLGNAMLRQGNTEKGTEYLSKASELAPDAAAIRTQLAVSHLASGATDQAIVELQTAADLGQELIQADLLLVLTHLRQNDIASAETAARELVKRRPDDPVAYNLLGAVMLAANDPGQARAAFAKQLQLDPDMASGYLGLARMDLDDGDLDSARERYQQLLERDARNLRALLGLAAVADRDDQPEERLQWLERAWASNPTSLSTGALLVDMYLKAGDRLRALNVARDVKARGPDQPVALNALGLALLANNELASAVQNFETLTQVSPDSPRAWELLASAQVRAERWRGARQSVSRAITLAPDSAPARIIKAQLDLRDRRYAEARSEIEKLAELRPDQAVVYRLRGELLRGEQKYEDAVKVLSKSQQLEPDSATLRLLAASLWQSGDHAGATTALEQWLQHNPDDAPARLQLAAARDRLQTADPMEEYLKILEQDPDNVVALNNVAWYLNERGDPKALKYAEKAAELAPNQPEVADTLGWVLVQNGELERGLQVLQQAALRAPHMPEVRYHLAIAYEKLERYKEAVEQLRGLLDAENFGSADDARLMLRRLEQKTAG